MIENEFKLKIRLTALFPSVSFQINHVILLVFTLAISFDPRKTTTDRIMTNKPHTTQFLLREYVYQPCLFAITF